MSHPTPANAARGDRLITAAAGSAVAGLAGIAGALSYAHMVTLAETHGEEGWQAHMLPLSVDGLELVASLVLLADRRAGRRSGKLPWLALAAGGIASLAANVAVADPGWIARVVAGWPAVALLIAVKLLAGLMEHHPVYLAAASGRSSAVRVPATDDRPRRLDRTAGRLLPVVPTTSAARCRWRQIWRDWQARGGSDSELAQRHGVSARTARYARAAGASGVLDASPEDSPGAP